MTREELLKVAKPILFNTEMVKAILEGRKACTRRAIKLDLGLADTDKNDSSYLMIPDEYGDYHDAKDLCRYQVGDYLYVRETWAKIEDFINYADMEIDKDLIYLFKCDDNGREHVFVDVGVKKWRPSIHMPKEAARIFLKVTDVRVERLQDITCSEAKKEGALADENIREDGRFLTEKGNFIDIWNSTIKKKDLDIYGFGANPFVWIIEFERVEVE